MKTGDIVEWNNNDFEQRKVITRISGKTEYSTFTEYLKNEGLKKCLSRMIKYGLLLLD